MLYSSHFISNSIHSQFVFQSLLKLIITSFVVLLSIFFIVVKSKSFRDLSLQNQFSFISSKANSCADSAQA